MIDELETRMMRAFKASEIMYPDDREVNLLEVGVDSIALLRLIVNIEKEFERVIPDEDLVFENFNTLHVMTSYLKKLLEGEFQSATH